MGSSKAKAYVFLLKIFFKFHSTVKTVYTFSYIYVSTALYNLQGSARHIESEKKKIVPHWSELRTFAINWRENLISCFFFNELKNTVIKLSSQNLGVEHNFSKIVWKIDKRTFQPYNLGKYGIIWENCTMPIRNQTCRSKFFSPQILMGRSYTIHYNCRQRSHICDF